MVWKSAKGALSQSRGKWPAWASVSFPCIRVCSLRYFCGDAAFSRRNRSHSRPQSVCLLDRGLPKEQRSFREEFWASMRFALFVVAACLPILGHRLCRPKSGLCEKKGSKRCAGPSRPKQQRGRGSLSAFETNRLRPPRAYHKNKHQMKPAMAKSINGVRKKLQANS